ncbi:MAG: hypothetical protein JXJ04_16550 [Spirochaetales bacterium]|nr:hypothetical protein [Spirochaetales bacterium]
MSYRILKHDFTQDELCHFCNSGRILKEAYFLFDESTSEKKILSQSCVRKIQNEINNWNGPFPDFTKGVIQNKGTNRTSDQDGKIERKRIENDDLIEYFIYRQEKLKDFLESIQRYQRKNLGITAKQKDAVMNTFTELNERWPKRKKIPKVDFVVII